MRVACHHRLRWLLLGLAGTMLCTPAVAQAPKEVTNAAFADDITLNWTAVNPSDFYNIYRGSLSELSDEDDAADVLRAILVECVTPETLFAGLGFRIWSSTRCNHLLLAPHPCEKAVWDIQLLQADPGGFELLERRVEEAREARTLRGKVLRTLGTRRLSGAHRFELVRQTDPETGEVRYADAKMVDSGEVVLSERDWQRWYDHVLDTIDRARRFDYLVREQDNPLQPYPAPTVIRFLRFAALIEPKHFAFFKNRDLQEAHPEIHWPPDRA